MAGARAQVGAAIQAVIQAGIRAVATPGAAGIVVVAVVAAATERDPLRADRLKNEERRPGGGRPALATISLSYFVIETQTLYELPSNSVARMTRLDHVMFFKSVASKTNGGGRAVHYHNQQTQA